MREPEGAQAASAKRRSWLRRCYDWTVAWADHPQAQTALFAVAVIEASVFPIPPDVLLLLLALGRPQLSWRLAAITTAGSTVGALIGYVIGMFLFASLAAPLLRFYHAMAQFEYVQGLFVHYGTWVVAVGGFSPIPFKVVTIAAGAFGLPLPAYFLAVIASRGLRFYLEGGLLYWGGARLHRFVERHFEWFTLIVALLVILGFAALWAWR